MRSYSKLSLSQRLIIYFIARSFYEEEIVGYHKYFDFFDVNLTGCINHETFKNILKISLSISSKTIEEVFKGIDIFENGFITYSQFIASSIHYSKYFTERNLLIFFQLIDIERTGRLSVKNLDKFITLQLKHRIGFSDELKLRLITDFNNKALIDKEYLQFVRILIK